MTSFVEIPDSYKGVYKPANVVAPATMKGPTPKSADKNLNWTDWLSPISWFAHRTEPGKKYIAPAIDVGDNAVKAVVSVMNEPYRQTLGKVLPSQIDDGYNWVHDFVTPDDMLGAALLVAPGVGAAGKMIKVENVVERAAAKRLNRAAEAGLTALSLMQAPDADEVVIVQDPAPPELPTVISTPTSFVEIPDIYKVKKPISTPTSVVEIPDIYKVKEPTLKSADPDAQMPAPGRMELKEPQAQEDAARYDMEEITISDPSTLPIMIGVALGAVIIAYVYNS